MKWIIEHIQHLFERQAFGVCTKLAEVLGVATSSVRLFFIYASFVTFGSALVIYLPLAFLMNIRKYLRQRRPVWDY